MTWYFSRALTAIGLLAGLVRVALAVIFEDPKPDLLGAVGTLVMLTVGAMLVGVVIDVAVRIRKRSHSKEPDRHRPHKRR